MSTKKQAFVAGLAIAIGFVGIAIYGQQSLVGTLSMGALLGGTQAAPGIVIKLVKGVR